MSTQLTGMRQFTSLSLPDAEPGLFSYAQIVFLLKTEFARARRYGIALTALIFRVDRLDSLRDLYGYRAKDFILERVTGILRRESRACDFIGKAPDDRLLMVVPHTTAEGGVVLAERLRKTVGAYDFEAEGKAMRVTLSAGLSTYEKKNVLFYDAVIYAAEAALEEATQRGGDMVVYHDAAEETEGHEDELDPEL
ncbi:MAG: diguanylate cyclase [Planctomycetes bacterium]|nr:diguanylate cyclase [Planctomycetota bacterium]